MITKIYLDMDGVLCDFEGRYRMLYFSDPSESRNKKDWDTNWAHFVLSRQFETLELFPGAKDLITYVRSLGVHIEILSSSGGNKYHNEVELQKTVWLANHRLFFPVNIVAGKKFKANYASFDSLLIDDTPEVIDSFVAAGGQGILYTTFKDAKRKMDKMFKVQTVS